MKESLNFTAKIIPSVATSWFFYTYLLFTDILTWRKTNYRTKQQIGLNQENIYKPFNSFYFGTSSLTLKSSDQRQIYQSFLYIKRHNYVSVMYTLCNIWPFGVVVPFRYTGMKSTVYRSGKSVGLIDLMASSILMRALSSDLWSQSVPSTEPV